MITNRCLGCGRNIKNNKNCMNKMCLRQLARWINYWAEFYGHPLRVKENNPCSLI